jgi:hypothetical protein
LASPTAAVAQEEEEDVVAEPEPVEAAEAVDDEEAEAVEHPARATRQQTQAHAIANNGAVRRRRHVQVMGRSLRERNRVE